MNSIKKLWIKCLTNRRYAHVTEAVVWLTLGLALGVFVLGLGTQWSADYPSNVPPPRPTPTVIP